MAKKLSQYDAILNASENTVIPILENGVNKKISADNLLKKNVINSLSSTEILKSLSAAQGKTLKDALDALTTTVENKQDSLVSGTNIKTINNTSILGAGNITIEASGSGLGGTNYVFVRGDGTPQENAIELQAKYNEAKTMPRYLGEIDFMEESTYYIGQTLKDQAGIGYYRVNTTFTGNLQSDDNIDGITEEEAFSTRSTVVVAPGEYTFTTPFTVDTAYIDIISLTGNSDAIFSGINVIANNIYLKGISCRTYTFVIESGLSELICENCIGGQYSFAGSGVASGTFINCIGGHYSFGGDSGVASGTFINCRGGGTSFGGGGGGIASGVFENCIGPGASFGGGGTASGTFTRCIGGSYSFGGSFGGTASGTFNYCEGEDGSFGGDTGTASGTFNYCIGKEHAFGGEDGGTIANTARLYYCRLKEGGFNTPGLGGKLVLCIDGNDTIITTT